MQAIILAGGAGKRAYPFTDLMPKPMIPINGKPILVHIIERLSISGINEVVLSLGYQKEVIIDYFHNKKFDWKLSIVDTGLGTDTGGRIRGCLDILGDQFIVTYGDGICDVPIDKLVEFHNSNKGLVTVTSVPLCCQYGTLSTDSVGKVVGFHEKPKILSHWINAGYAIFEKEALNLVPGDNLEIDLYPKLAELGQLYTYRHDGFFKSVDTLKDRDELADIL